MAVVLRTRPRAYVAAPVAPANGLFHAINWAFEQAEDLSWSNLGILVANPAMVAELGHLHRLKTRGVRIGTPGQANRARSFHGVVIAYCPDPVMLAVPENLPGTRGVAAVAPHNEHLLEWVSTYAPQHLGGDALAIPPQGREQVSTRSKQPLQPSP